jgi:hypothetical protein
MSDKPKFIDAFIFIISFNPSSVKWAFLLINSTTCLNKYKSAAFWLNNGYLSKWRSNFIKSLFESIE